jgi:hypothetical protein
MRARNHPSLRIGYYHPDLGDDPEDDPFAFADMHLTRRIAAVVEEHYPGHPWLIEVSHRQGIVRLSIPALMGGQNCYVVHIGALKSDPGMRAIRRGCGEILERYRIPRSGFRPAEFLSAVQARPLFERLHGAVPE